MSPNTSGFLKVLFVEDNADTRELVTLYPGKLWSFCYGRRFCADGDSAGCQQSSLPHRLKCAHWISVRHEWQRSLNRKEHAFHVDVEDQIKKFLSYFAELTILRGGS